MPQSHGHEGLHNIGEGNDGEWKYQVRINLSEEFASAARTDLDDPSLRPLKEILDRHGVTLKNQFDAFSGYCAEVEAQAVAEGWFKKLTNRIGLTRSPTDVSLYKWTRHTIDRPGKEEQYATRFTVYQGDSQIYDKNLADAIEADFEQLKEGGMITRINKIDSNPANNPQAPARFQR